MSGTQTLKEVSSFASSALIKNAEFITQTAGCALIIMHQETITIL